MRSLTHGSNIPGDRWCLLNSHKYTPDKFRRRKQIHNLHCPTNSLVVNILEAKLRIADIKKINSNSHLFIALLTCQPFKPFSPVTLSKKHATVRVFRPHHCSKNVVLWKMSLCFFSRFRHYTLWGTEFLKFPSNAF